MEDEIEPGRREFIYIIVVIQAIWASFCESRAWPGCHKRGLRRTALIYNNKTGARSSLKSE